MDVSHVEVVEELQRLFPEHLRVCVLSVINRKQASRITELETAHVATTNGNADSGNTGN